MRTQSSSDAASEVLAVSFELGDKKWVLGFLAAGMNRPRVRTVRAHDFEKVLSEIKAAKAKAGLPGDAAVVSCYEAGREGFWLHRDLLDEGIRSHVINSASIEVTRESRQCKTDRLDAVRLVGQMYRQVTGDPTLRWRPVNVPSREAEDARYETRHRGALIRDRSRYEQRIATRLRSQGITGVNPYKADFAALRDRKGRPLGAQLQWILRQQQEMLLLIAKQCAELEAARRERLQEANDEITRRASLLEGLCGIGQTTAFALSQELGWRDFRNRRQITGLAGLGGTPWASGTLYRDQGVGAGIPQIRTLMIQIAWQWLRRQPRSALTRWFRKHFSKGSGKDRRIGIVALARRLLIALWRFWTRHEIPEGAMLKPIYC